MLTSSMRERSNYEDPDLLRDFLAEQLAQGALAIVLGAGASKPFGLPDWGTLIDQLHKDCGLTRDLRQSAEVSAETLLSKGFKGDRVELANAIRNAMYDGKDLSLNTLRKSDLLSAIGALTMASARGSVSRVVTFNYDDLVERYLRFFGFDVRTVRQAPYWAGRADVAVLHPHGFLPNDLSAPASPVVLTQADYDEVIGNAKNAWRAAMLEVFSSHTCLFIGLSGDDKNLTSLLSETKARHASLDRGDIFWGVRFSTDDSYRDLWENRGVFPRIVASHDEGGDPARA